MMFSYQFVVTLPPFLVFIFAFFSRNEGVKVVLVGVFVVPAHLRVMDMRYLDMKMDMNENLHDFDMSVRIQMPRSSINFT